MKKALILCLLLIAFLPGLIPAQTAAPLAADPPAGERQTGAARAAVASGSGVVEAQLHENVTNAFLNPGKTSNLPRVLIIGDSISIGYTDIVRKKLAGTADVFRPPQNCAHSGVGVTQVKNWLGTNHWDVIHFNFGIWDTHLLDAKGKIAIGDELPDKSELHIRHTPEQYRENLVKIIAALKATNARLIWASTTPIMSRKGDRMEAIPGLNRTAAELMQEQKIPVDDLYAFVLPRIKEWQSADQCHFTALGNVAMGKQVADSIRGVLNPKTP